MLQHGQVLKLKSKGSNGEALWAYRHRLGGHGSTRVQRGGFRTERDAREALQRELEVLRRLDGVRNALTLAELVDEYLTQHDAEPVTIEKLRWLLAKATAAFGDRRLSELRPHELAAWRMTIAPGHRRGDPGAAPGAAKGGRLGDAQRQPGETWSRQSDSSAQGAAPIRVVGATSRARRGARLAARSCCSRPQPASGPASGLRSSAATSIARRKSSTCAARSPTPPEAHQDRGERPRGPAAGDRARRARRATELPAYGASLPSPRGGYLDLRNFRNRHRKPAQLEAGIEPVRRIYDLRHTFATFALRAGISTFELSRYMGTSLLMIDRHYGHLARDGREHAVRLLDSSIDAGVQPRGRSVDVAALARGSARAGKPHERR